MVKICVYNFPLVDKQKSTKNGVMSTSEIIIIGDDEDDSQCISFVESLSCHIPNEKRRHPEVFKYLNFFDTNKFELCRILVEEFAVRVFKNSKLCLDINWNKNLKSRSGQCKTSRKNGTILGCKIEISTSICRTPEIVRNVLIHELSHAATALVDRKFNHGHGIRWKRWIRKIRKMYPLLPRIGRCHSYEQDYKYKYKCVRCSFEKNHHKKVGKQKKKCSRCGSKSFELFQRLTEGGLHFLSIV